VPVAVQEYQNKSSYLGVKQQHYYTPERLSPTHRWEKKPLFTSDTYSSHSFIQRQTLFSYTPLHSPDARKMEFLNKDWDVSRPEAFFHPHTTFLKVKEGTSKTWERATSKLYQ